MTVERLEERLTPVTDQWTGLGANFNWSTAKNWTNGVPQPGYDLVFPANVPIVSLINTNDLNAGTQFNSITFSGSGYTVSGNTIGLGNTTPTGSLIANVGATNDVVGMNVVLTSAPGSRQFFTVNTAGAFLTLTGTLSSSNGVGMTKTGPGTFVLSGDGSGFSGGITVQTGSLQITVPTALGTGTNSTTVQSGAQLQVNGSAGAVLNVPEPLILNGPGVANDGAILNVSGNNTWAGNIEMDSDTTFGANAGSLVINGQISDTGQGHSLIKEGIGEVDLDPLGVANGNTYRKQTIVNNGILGVRHSLALGPGGSVNDGAIVNSFPNESGTLQLQFVPNPARIDPNVNPTNDGFTVPNEFLTINGPGKEGVHVFPRTGAAAPATDVTGALSNLSGNNAWTQNIVLWSGTTAVQGDPAFWPDPVVAVGAEKNSNLTLNGQISDQSGGLSYSFVKTRAGRVILTDNNLYTGFTEVIDGYLNLRDSGALGPSAGVLGAEVLSGASMELEADAKVDSFNSNPSNQKPNLDPANLLAGQTATDITIQNVPLTIEGTGANNDGALRNISGINYWTGHVTLTTLITRVPSFTSTTAAIGVEPDPDPFNNGGLTYNDFSQLTVSGVVSGAHSGDSLTKVRDGELVLTNANTWTGGSFIKEGWVTLRNNLALGATFSTRTYNDLPIQPMHIVSGGAAVILKTDVSSGSPTPINVDSNLTLTGNGMTLANTQREPWLLQKGALATLDGLDTESGNIVLNGQAGIGAEQDGNLVEPPVGGPVSEMTLTGDYSETGGAAGPGGITKLGSQRVYLQGAGTYNGPVEIAAGVLRVQNSTALGTGVGGTKVDGGGALELQASVPVETGGLKTGTQVIGNHLTLNGMGNTTAYNYNSPGAHIAALTNFSDDNMWRGPITLGSNTAIDSDSGSRLTLYGNIDDSTNLGPLGSSLAIAGDAATDGKLVLAGNNIYRGTTTIGMGTVNLQNGAGLGVPSTPEVQTLTVSGNLNGTFTLTFNGQTTASLNATAPPAQVQAQLNGLLTIGGVGGAVAVTQSGTVYTVVFQGNLSGFAQNLLVATPSAGTNVVVAEKTIGHGGVIVSPIAAVDLQGDITVAGKSIQVQGQGSPTAKDLTPIANWFPEGPAPILNGETVGNQPVTGRVSGVTVDQFDPNVIYVTGAQGGVWKTTDDGLTWKPLTDAVGASVIVGTASAPVIAPTNNNGNGYIGLSFGSTQGFIPPDTNGAAGPASYVESVNQSVAIFTPKATGTAVISDTFDHFFPVVGNLPAADSGSFFSDPITVYDDNLAGNGPTDGRFIVGDQDVDFSSHVNVFDIAVSKSANPATLTAADWNFYQINTTESGFDSDYPGNFGYTKDAFVFTLNEFSTGSGSNNVEVVSVSTADLLAGVAQGSLHSFINFVNNDFSLRPATVHDTSTSSMWLLSQAGDGLHINVYQMKNPLSSPAQFVITQLAVPAYTDIAASGVVPLQPDGSQVVTNIDSRILKAAVTGGTLVATHAVTVSSTEDDAQWYKIDLTGGTPVMSDFGRVGFGNNTYAYYPSVDINSAGDIGMTFMDSGTAANEYMSMYVTGRKTTDAAGTMETPIIVPNGTGLTNYSDFGQRAGDMSAMNIDPVDNSFWAANEFANTDTGGANWGTAIANFTLGTVPIVQGGAKFQSAFTGAMAVAPEDPAIMYMGGGEGNNSYDSFYGRGVYKSTDSGQTWTLLQGNPGKNELNRGTITKIVVDPINPNIIYVAENGHGGGINSLGGEGGIWRYNGFSWVNLTQQAGGPSDNTTTSFSLNDDYTDVAVSVETADGANTRFIAFAIGTPDGNVTLPPQFWTNGVYISVDNGQTFNLNSFALTENVNDDGATTTIPRNGVIKLGMTTTFNSSQFTVYAAVTYPTTWWDPFAGPGEANSIQPQANTFRELDKVTITAGGKINSWGTPSGQPGSDYQGIPGGPDENGDANTPKQGSTDTVLAVDPYDPNENTVFVGGMGRPLTSGGVWETRDGSNSWSDVGPGINAAGQDNGPGPHSDYQSMTFDHFSGGERLLVGTDGGVWRLDNAIPGSISWEDLNGNLAITELDGLAQDPANPFVAYGGSEDNGAENLNNALAWNHTDNGDGGAEVIDNLRPNIIYHVQDGNLRKSTDSGATWTTVFGGNAQYFPLIIDNVNTSRILLGFGATPEESAQQGNPGTFVNLDPTRQINQTITALAYANLQGPFVADSGFPLVTDTGANSYVPNTIYVATSNGVFLTKDHGNTWRNRSAGLPGGPVQDITVDPNNSDVAYVVYSKFNSLRQVWKTTDAGLTWSNITGNLPDLPAYTIVVDSLSEDLYLGNDNGVWRLPNGSTTWSAFGVGMPNTQVRVLRLDPNNDRLSAATYGRGMFELWLDNTRANGGAIRAAAGQSVWTGNIAMTSNVVVRAELNSQVTLVGNIANAVNGAHQQLIKTGPGTVVLAGTNTYGGIGVTSASIVSGGSGYVVNDVLTVQGGTATQAAQLTVTAVDAFGAVTAVSVAQAGTYTVAPTNPVTVTGGTGINATFNLVTLTNDTFVKEGVLTVENPLALGASTTGTVVSKGAGLYLQSDVSGEPLTLNGDGIPFNGHNTGSLRSVSNFNTYSGNITLATSTTIGVDSGSQLTITGTIVDGANPPIPPGGGVQGGPDDAVVTPPTHSLTKELTGTLILNPTAAGGNTYAGGTIVEQGALNIRQPLALGIQGIGAAAVVFGGSGYSVGDVLTVQGGTSTVPAQLTVTAVGAGGDVTAVVVTQIGNYTVLPTNPVSVDIGTATFSLTPTSLGTQVEDGAQLQMQGGITVNNQALTLSGTGIFGTGALLNVAGNNTWQSPVTLSSIPVNLPPLTIPVQGVAIGVANATDNLTIDGVVNETVGVAMATVVNGGGGYFAGQVLTLKGGTFTQPAQLTVTSVGGFGNITGVTVTEYGVYTTVPANPAGVTVGAATFNLTKTHFGITKVGPGTVTLQQPNVYTGITTVSTGILDIQDPGALGTAGGPPTNGTVVNTGATLALDLNPTGGGGPQTVTGETLTLNGAGVNGMGALDNVSGTNTWAGAPIILNTNSSIGVDVGSLTVTGGVRDPIPVPTTPATLTKVGVGTLFFPTANTYKGLTQIPNGILNISHVGALGATNTPEVQTVTSSGLNGTFALTFNGQTTPTLPYNVPATGGVNPQDSLQNALNSLTSIGGTVGGSVAVVLTGTSDVQTVTVTGTSGTFKLTFNGQQTVALPFNVPATGGVNPQDSLQNALGALSTIGGTANVNVTLVGTVYTVTFAGTLQFFNQPQMTATFTGGDSVVVATQTPGNGVYNITFQGSLAGFPQPLFSLATGTSAIMSVTRTTAGTGGTAVTSINAVQTVTVTGSAGTFTLSYNGQSTGALPFNVPASGGVGPTASMQNALNALSTIANLGGSVTVSQAGNVYTVTFGGGLAGVPVLTLGSTGSGGASAAVAVVSNGVSGTLQVMGGITYSNETVELSGPGYLGSGALDGASGLNTWDSSVALVGNASIGADTLSSPANPPTLNVDKTISELVPGSALTKVGLGNVMLSGPTSNIYTGLTTVNDGLLMLNKSGTALAVPGNLLIGDTPDVDGAADTDTAQLVAPNQLAPSATITIISDGSFDLNHQTQSIAALLMTGGSVTLTGNTSDLTLTGGVTAASGTLGVPATISGAGNLTLNTTQTFTVNGPGPKSPDMLIASIINGAGGLTKAGTGTLELTADNAFGGTTTVTQGTLLADGPNAAATVGAVTLNGVTPGVGNLGGVGTVTSITSGANGGMVTPGNTIKPVGTLTSGPVTWNGSTNFNVTLEGTGTGNAATAASLLNVLGPVSLNGANLIGTIPILSNITDAFTILSATGNISGAFGNTVVQGGVTYAFIAGEKFQLVINNVPATKTITLTHVPANTVTTVTASANPSVFGQNVTFTATVLPETGATGSPSGTVNFVIDGTTVASGVPINTSGVATFQTASVNTPPLPLSVGGSPHSVVAFFTDAATDGFFNNSDNSANPFLETVKKANTQTAVTADHNPSVFGQTVVFTATVTAPSSLAVPTGQVTWIIDGQTVLANQALSGGVATFSTASLTAPLSVGGSPHSVVVNYTNLDGNFINNSGAALPGGEVVNKDATTVTVNSTNTNAVYGEPIITATVAAAGPGAGTPTGTVTFVVNGVTPGETDNITTVGGKQVAVMQQVLTPGTYTITATYNGDGSFLAHTGTLSPNQVVSAANVSVAVASNHNPAVFGQPVTFSATITPVSPGGSAPGSAKPQGTANLVIDSTTVATGVAVVNGQVTFSPTSAIMAALTTTGSPHAVQVFYNVTATGTDPNYASSSAFLTGGQTINKSDTSVAVSTNVNPAVFGQPVTFSATITPVSPGAGSPGGSANLYIDNTTTPVFSNIAVVSGHVTFPATSANLTVQAAPHLVKVVYNGDASFNGNSALLTPGETIKTASSQTQVTADVNPAVYGQVVTFTATVGPVSPSTATPAGTVVFLIDGVQVSSAITLSGGTATFKTSSLSTPLSVTTGGPAHTVKVNYTNTDGSFFNSSGSLANGETVNQANTTTTIGSTNANAVYGEPIITATVAAQSPGAGTPTGTVTFSGAGITTETDNLTTVGSNQVAVFQQVLVPGSYSITASYNGDSNFLTSSTGISPFSQTISKASVTVTVGSSQNPSVTGQAVTFSATIAAVSPGGTAPGSLLPQGSAILTIDGHQIGSSVNVVNGAVSFPATTAFLTVTSSPHSVQVFYTTDGNYASNNGSLSGGQTVNKASTGVAVSSNHNPSVFGQPVTFSAVITPVSPGSGAPGGTATLFIDGNQIGVAATVVPGVSNSTVSFPATTQFLTAAAAAHSVQIVYNGDANFAGNNAFLTGGQTVNKANTTTAVTSSATNNTSSYGQQVTFTATVSAVSPGAGTPSGTVKFYDGVVDNAHLLGSGSLSQTTTDTASYMTLPLQLTGGSHTIIAAYQSDNSFGPSQGNVSQTVLQDATNTTDVTSNNPGAIYGQSITFTSTVSSQVAGVGVPTGTINFYDGAVNATDLLGAGTVDGSGKATLTLPSTSPVLPALGAGGHTITAVYQGDVNFLASTSPTPQLSQNVTKATTSTTIASDTLPTAVYGQETIKATVVDTTASSTGTPTGNVIFTITAGSNSAQVTVALVSGVAILTTPTSVSTALTAGGGSVTYSISAAYQGDGNFQKSDTSTTGGPLTQTVQQANSSTTLSATPSSNQSVAGQQVTLTAVVTAFAPGAGLPSGTVKFYDGPVNATDLIGSQSLSLVGSQEQASITISSLAVGTAAHPISAVYQGDNNFLTSTSNTVNFTVNQAQTSTSVSSAPSTSTYGQQVTFTATVGVNTPGAGTATGTVNFYDNVIDANHLLGTGTLNQNSSSDQTTFTTAATQLTGGNHTIIAFYTGDTNYLTSQGSTSQTVQKVGTTTGLVSSKVTPVASHPFTVTATVTSNAAGLSITGGMVTFTVDGGSPVNVSVGSNGQAVTTITLATPGNHTIGATYSGDVNFFSSAGSLPVTALTPNGGFVAQVYRDLLHREVDPGGLASWTAALDQGLLNRTQFVFGLESSTEYRSDVVDALYVHYLHRHADPGGLAAFVNAMAHGMTDEQVAAFLAGSDEYFSNRGGGTVDGFITALYVDALNRQPDPQGRAAFEQALSFHVSRQQVATSVLGSFEYKSDLVFGYYSAFLHRSPDPNGQNAWANAMTQGLTDEQVIAAIIGSQEYFNNL
jgi:autotransporter-associated beta strand protein